MEENSKNLEIIQRASEALDRIGRDEEGDTSEGKRVVLELKDKIIALMQDGVSRRKICKQLENIGIKVTPYMIEKYITMETNKKQDIKAASKTLKAMIEQPELVGSSFTPGIKFVMDNKENIKKLIENGWTMKMIMSEFAKFGIKCSPQTVRKYVGISKEKRHEKEKSIQVDKGLMEDKKTDKMQGDSSGLDVQDASGLRKPSAINPDFRDNDRVKRWNK